MNPNSTEKETHLIERLLELENVLHIISIEKHYCVEEPEKSKIEQFESETKSEFDLVKQDLQNLETYEVSLSIRDDLIQAFNQMIHSISMGREELQISKSQSMIFYNYFIARIFEEIHKTMNLNFSGISTPFLYFTSDPEDSFDRKKLISFLRNEINILNAITAINYIVLQDFYQNFKYRLSELVEI